VRVTYEGGSSWRLVTQQGLCLAVNPAWNDTVGTGESVRYPIHPGRVIDVAVAPTPDVVIIAGSRPEQLDLPTLHGLSRGTVIFCSPLLPSFAIMAMEILGFSVVRIPFSADASVTDARIRFQPPSATDSAALPTPGMLVAEAEAAFRLRGDGPALPLQGPTLEMSSEASNTPGASWLVDTEVRRDRPADWVQPHCTAESSWPAGPLAPAPSSDAEARDRQRQVIEFLPELARDLTLYPPTGPVRPTWTAGQEDGLGPKRLLLTLVAGPGTSVCQFALDVTRSGFVPAHEALDVAREAYPCGLTIHIDDLAALLKGEFHIDDILMVAECWSNENSVETFRSRLRDLFTVARPRLEAKALFNQANSLIANWATELLVAGRTSPGPSENR
jgi:hypothetical protein